MFGFYLPKPTCFVLQRGCSSTLFVCNAKDDFVMNIIKLTVTSCLKMATATTGSQSQSKANRQGTAFSFKPGKCRVCSDFKSWSKTQTFKSLVRSEEIIVARHTGMTTGRPTLNISTPVVPARFIDPPL